MKKLISTLILIFAFTPGLALGEETPKNDPKDIVFFIDAIAGPERLEFEVSLKNQGDSPITFEFLSSLKFDIVVEDYQGVEVYRFSKEKFFTPALEQIELKANQDITWTEEWHYLKDGKRVKEEEYTVKAVLKAIKVNNAPVKQSITDSKTIYIPQENPVFKNIKATGSKGNYQVTGKTRPIAGEFFYTVEDGHNELVRQTSLKSKTKYPEWSDFLIEVKISENKLPDNGTLILNLYERDQKENKIIHVYPVVLEKFY